MSSEFHIDDATQEEKTLPVQPSAPKKQPRPFKNRRGRPRRNFSVKKFERLAYSYCSQHEIAAIFGCGIATIKRLCTREPYRAIWQAALAAMRAELKLKMFELAREGNVQMLIWLGKQYLRQSERGSGVIFDGQFVPMAPDTIDAIAAVNLPRT